MQNVDTNMITYYTDEDKLHPHYIGGDRKWASLQSVLCLGDDKTLDALLLEQIMWREKYKAGSISRQVHIRNSMISDVTTSSML
jgi:hypothetical protein